MRWSARMDAVKRVRNYLDEIPQVLQDIVDNENEATETRNDANLLFNRILRHELFALLGFWNSVLTWIDRVQKRLQDPTVNFHYASLDLKGLCDYFIASREVLVADSLEEGLNTCRKWQKSCRRSQRVIHDVSIIDELTAKNNMRKTMNEAIDRLHKEMNARYSRLHDLDTKFGFLIDILFLRNGSFADPWACCNTFGNVYSNDIDATELFEEILDCRMLFAGREHLQISNPEELLQFIFQYGDESVFPNLRVAIQILLTVAVSIAGWERFSAS
ncbi:Hypothetical predicted protein [Octopus vulgaris]|uniref:Uncharacterized protein n=1 Tax=Octopus vulgaris TaxID=6645 RepID=A0AA36BEZ8_OCTVU|nr:Hypothetical predicted protein [Octopus vulgaris]